MEQIVLVDLPGNVELGGLEAAIALPHHVGTQHSRYQDALARVGEHEVIVHAVGQAELMLAQRVGVDVDVVGKAGGVASELEGLVESDDYRLKCSHGYQGTLFVVLRGPEFSSRVWRTRSTVLVSDLRLSSRCARTDCAYSSAL